MKGHEKLLAMRLRGKRPAYVFMECGEDARKPGLTASWHTDEVVTCAYVNVLPEEPLAALDLRFCVGMPVVLTGSEEKRTRALSAALMAAGAKRVDGYVTEPVYEYGVWRTKFLVEWRELKGQDERNQ